MTTLKGDLPMRVSQRPLPRRIRDLLHPITTIWSQLMISIHFLSHFTHLLKKMLSWEMLVNLSNMNKLSY